MISEQCILQEHIPALVTTLTPHLIRSAIFVDPIGAAILDAGGWPPERKPQDGERRADVAIALCVTSTCEKQMPVKPDGAWAVWSAAPFSSTPRQRMPILCRVRLRPAEWQHATPSAERLTSSIGIERTYGSCAASCDLGLAAHCIAEQTLQQKAGA